MRCAVIAALAMVVTLLACEPDQRAAEPGFVILYGGGTLDVVACSELQTDTGGAVWCKREGVAR